MAIQAVRGMKDLLPPEVYKFQFIEQTAREVFTAFGFGEIRIPVLEKTELFSRSIGEATDIVEKEMYTFPDRSQELLTMRPEATAGIMRAAIQHKLAGAPGPHKLFLIGPMFRHERPQKGRLRQFHQLDAEILGDPGPLVDAELMVMLASLVEKLGATEVRLVVNSLGCPECRPAFRAALVDFFSAKIDQLCDDCKRRLSSNPLRLLDCKVEGCRAAAAGAPLINQHHCPACTEHFAQVRGLLEEAKVSFEVDPNLVRGLDYYSRTTFEVKAGGLGAQDAVAGGGRYDGLSKELGGPDMPAIGFAAGMERLALLLDDDKFGPPPVHLFIAALGPEARRWAFGKAQRLRKAGVACEMSGEDKSLKAQLRKANKLSAWRVLIVGGQELAEGRGQLKNMLGDGQETISLHGAWDKLLLEKPKD